MKVDKFFRSIYTIGTEGYQWDDDLRNLSPTELDIQLEDINRNWIQHVEENTTSNKHYKNEDNGAYTINV